MPTTKVDHTTPTIVNSQAGPVTLTIEPRNVPITLVVTSSAGTITITGTSIQGRPVDVLHTP